MSASISGLRTITSNDKKLVILAQLMRGHVWKGGDNLLLRRQICALFELEIANGPTEGQIAIDSAKVDKATGCAYARLFAFVLRLVVEG